MRFYRARFKQPGLDNRGIIPIPIIAVMAILSLLAATGIGFYLGSGAAFSIGLGAGAALVVLLPNLSRIILWFKEITALFKSRPESKEVDAG